MKFLGLMRVKDEWPWVQRSLASQAFCDKIIVLSQDTTSFEQEHVYQNFSNVHVIPSPFTGDCAGRDREFLCEIARHLRPEWVVTLDGDEVLEDAAWQKLQAVADDPRVTVIEILSRHLWDNERTVRVDGHFNAGWRQRIWRLPAGRLTFQPHHCALPDGLDRGPFTRIGLELWHYGSINVAKRRRRFEACVAIDPRGVDGGNYRVMIQGDPGGPDPREVLSGESMRLEEVR